MARHFVRLKLALIRNSVSGGGVRTAGFVMGIVFAVPLSLIGFFTLALQRVNAHASSNVAIGFCAALFAAWLLFPILGFGSDETLDPARLVSLPLTRRQLITGLLVASAVGVAPIACLVALSGALIGYSGNTLALVLVIAAVAIEMALCISCSRAIITLLSRGLRSRRGRDVTVMFGAVVFLLGQLAYFSGISRRGRPHLDALVPWVRWTPPGFVGRAIADASRGHDLAAALWLLAALAFVALFLGLWSWALERVNTSAEAAAGVRQAAGGSLFPAVLRFLPRTRVGAVAAREVRYLLRDPKRRVAILPTLFMPFLPVITTLQQGGHLVPTATFGALLATFIAAQLALNQFGLDGSAYWTNVAAGNDPQADLTGKNVATFITTFPIVVAVALVLAALGRGWVYVPAVAGLSVAVLAVELGVGNVVSVRAPQAVPDSRSNLWANNTGQGCIAGLLSLLALLTEVMLLVPVAIVVGIALSSAPLALFGVIPASIAYSGVIWWLGRRSAARWVWWRQPELLEAMSLRQSA